MKVILTMAISANGIIATKTGSEDFLSHDNWMQFVRLARKVGCFMWGRKTYEAVIKWEGDYLSDLKSVKKVIISGGSITNSYFAKKCLIDEIILDVNPSIIGEGIPVFAPEDFVLKLDLLNVERVGNGVVEFRYKVQK